MISSKLIESIFLMYFSIVLRSKEEAIVIVRSQWSTQIKSAIISDLMSFSALLMWAIYLQDMTMNLVELDRLIGTNICLLDGLLVVMLNLGFSFLSSLIILCTSSIFLNKRLGKFSLILIISTILEENTCAYDCPFWVLIFFFFF